MAEVKQPSGAETLANKVICPTFPDELRDVWSAIPHKQVFLPLLAGWLVLFQFLGNSTLGYVKSASLFVWLYGLYNSPFHYDDHGLFIPFVVLGLFWWKRAELLAVEKRLWGPGLLILAAGMLLHVAGFTVQQGRLSAAGMFLGVYGLMGMIWGPAFLRGSFFPFVLFVFCIPLGTLSERIAFPLRLLSTKLAVGVSHLVFDVPVIQDGTRLIEPGGRFEYEVAAACSGLRSLSAMVMLSVVFGALSFRTAWKRLAIVLLAFPLAVMSNVVRLLVIILAAQAFGQQAGLFVHDSSLLSLLPYVPAILVLAALGHWLGEEVKSVTASPSAEARQRSAKDTARRSRNQRNAAFRLLRRGKASPRQPEGCVPVAREKSLQNETISGDSVAGLAGNRNADGPNPQRVGNGGGRRELGQLALRWGRLWCAGSDGGPQRKWVLFAAALGVMLAGGGLILRLQAVQKLGAPGVQLAKAGAGLKGEVVLPATPPGYLSKLVPVTQIELEALPADTSFGRRSYQAEDGFEALATVVLMGTDRTSIHQPQLCLVGQGWNITHTEETTVPLHQPKAFALPVMKLTTAKAIPVNGRSVPYGGVYVYWFVCEDRLTARHEQRMWWMASELIRTGVLQRWAYVTFFAVCAPGQEEATFSRLKDLIAATVPEFQRVAGPPVVEQAPPR